MEPAEVEPLPEDVDFSEFGDEVIDQEWTIGDATVAPKGYDMRILPPSGIAELTLYRCLLVSCQ